MPIKKYKVKTQWTKAIQFDGTNADEIFKLLKDDIKIEIFKSWDKTKSCEIVKTILKVMNYHHECWVEAKEGDYIIISNQSLSVEKQSDFEEDHDMKFIKIKTEEEGRICPNCKGTGKVPSHSDRSVTCGVCKGNGKVIDWLDV